MSKKKRKPPAQQPLIAKSILPKTPTERLRQALPHMLVTEDADGSRHLNIMPGKERCDFCSSPEPVWAFGCEDVALTTRPAYEDVSPGVVSLGEEVHGSRGNWGACKECKFLIDRREVKKLADRSARAMFEVHPEFKGVMTLTSLRREIEVMHRQFWAHRKPEWDHAIEPRRTHSDRRRER